MAKQYTKQNLLDAVKEVKDGNSVRSTAKKFGIPHSTHNDHCSGTHTKIGAGALTALPEAIEKQIVMTCQILAKIGFAMSRDLVEVVVREYVTKTSITTPFTNGIPGRDWWERFLKRWARTSRTKTTTSK